MLFEKFMHVNSEKALDIPQKGQGNPVILSIMQELSSLNRPGTKRLSKSKG